MHSAILFDTRTKLYHSNIFSGLENNMKMLWKDDINVVKIVSDFNSMTFCVFLWFSNKWLTFFSEHLYYKRKLYCSACLLDGICICIWTTSPSSSSWSSCQRLGAWTIWRVIGSRQPLLDLSFPLFQTSLHCATSTVQPILWIVHCTMYNLHSATSTMQPLLWATSTCNPPVCNLFSVPL